MAVHPRKDLDGVIHAPVRFSIVAALAVVDEVDFKTLAETIDVSDSAMSKHLSVLTEAGYIAPRKTFVGKFPRTYVSLTTAGRKAWERHVAALREIAGLTEP
ncbi:winged helix-turn-helix domain-containing protein [Nonomuraea helvata]|uniref:Winged helix-turn-helix domain-containing protein n=1 Tax=Nonomuraea helvata TaxID=37484 RepID=A0ABV5SAL3_9ACTN